MQLPSSEACERNKAPILRVLRGAFSASTRVLEIGSGTGQHAVHFASGLRHLLWQPSDRTDYLPDLTARIKLEGPPNLLPAIELDVSHHPWPEEAQGADAVFAANVLHIMSWSEVEHFFRGVGEVLGDEGVACVYGPLRYAGQYTSASNESFDRYLKVRDPQSGIRDFEAVDALAQTHGLRLLADHAMPANNQTLVWAREP